MNEHIHDREEILRIFFAFSELDLNAAAEISIQLSVMNIFLRVGMSVSLEFAHILINLWKFI